MKIITLVASEGGSRPPLQDWKGALPDGYALCPDEFVEVFYSTTPSGFVNITVEDFIVVGMTINQEALDAYIAEHPEQPEPSITLEEQVAELRDALDMLLSGVVE